MRPEAKIKITDNMIAGVFKFTAIPPLPFSLCFYGNLSNSGKAFLLDKPARQSIAEQTFLSTYRAKVRYSPILNSTNLRAFLSRLSIFYLLCLHIIDIIPLFFYRELEKQILYRIIDISYDIYDISLLWHFN